MATAELYRALSDYLSNQTAGASTGIGPKLIGWIGTAGPGDLIRVNAYELASKLGADRREMLELFVDLVYQGLFDLNWEFHCPYCNGITGRHAHLSSATSQSACTVCRVRTPFTNELDGTVEVTFSPVARLYEFSRSFVEEETRRIIAQIEADTLRMPATYVRGIDCLQLPSFREKFGDEVLSRSESLSIKRICIMFTDVKGSTALYERLGDAKAYRLVREHFDRLFQTVGEEGGTIVKTIGDSVMAAFTAPEQGVGAALRIEDAFRALARREAVGPAVRVKIGLHTGPCLLVNLDGRSDYFGRTINLASRIENVAEGGEVYVSEELRNDAAAVRRMRGAVKSLTRRRITFKGIEEPQTVFRLNTVEPGTAAANGPARDELPSTRPATR